MAKNRYINTKFWDDPFIIDCDPIEKLLFLYFLTNPLTSICGMYEIKLKRIAFDTGIDQDMVSKILERFTAAGRIYYINNWIVITNFIKHQNLNPNMQKGLEKQLGDVPKEVLETLANLNCNSNSNCNSNIKHLTDRVSKPLKAFESLSGEGAKSKKKYPDFQSVVDLYYGIGVDYVMSAKEGKFIKHLLDKYSLDEITKTTAILKQIKRTDSWWAKQPVIPSVVYSNWDRIRESIKEPEHDTSWAD